MTTANNNVQTKNNEYARIIDDWRKLRHCLEGQREIKRQSTVYLPMPPAIQMASSSTEQSSRYEFYLSFAEYPEMIQPTVDGIQGIIHSKPPVIELPPQIEYMLESATFDGKSLIKLWEDITRELFITGRIGLLADLPDLDNEDIGGIPEEEGVEGEDVAVNRIQRLLNFQGLSSNRPITGAQTQVQAQQGNVYLCQYSAECIINWRKKKFNSGAEASLVVLHENIDEPTINNEFSNDRADLYRVLRFDKVNEFQYTQQLFLFFDNNNGYSESNEFEPQRIGRKFEEIPLTIINAINLEFDVGPIPLLPMANKTLDIYRKSASYNRALYLVGDPTVVRTGITPEESKANSYIGGGQAWDFTNPQARAELLELKGDSIPSVRMAIQDDHEQARNLIGQLFDNKAGVEASDSLRIRQANKQVTVRSIVINAAKGLERSLKNCATIMGGNPDDVRFDPNLDFTELRMTGQELLQFTTARNSGAPLSRQTIHELARKGGLTTLTFEEETEVIASEAPDDIGGGTDDIEESVEEEE